MRIRLRCIRPVRVVWSIVVGLACCTTMIGQKNSKYKCDEPQPETMCAAANTCGSPSSACTVGITKSGESSNVKPKISATKNNQFFCVKAGTTVVWKSPKKNVGFLVSFGVDSPFQSDVPISGGGKKPVSTVARTPGCYKYDVGTFISGRVYGVSGNRPELVILP